MTVAITVVTETTADTTPMPAGRTAFRPSPLSPRA